MFPKPQSSSLAGLFAGLLLAGGARAADEPAAPAARSELVVQAGHYGQHGASHTHSIAFAPNGRLAATGGNDGVCLWDVRSARQLGRLEGHTDPVHAVAFNPDGTKVLTASNDTTARVWDVATTREVLRLRGHSGGIERAAFAPDGTRVLTAGRDGTARVWDARTGKEVARLTLWEERATSGRVTGLAWAPDGGRVLTATGKEVAAWDAETGKRLAGFPLVENRRYESVSFSPDGKRVLTAEGAVTLWEVETGKELRRFGRFLLPTRGADGKPAPGTFAGYDQASRTVACLSPDGKRVAAGDGEGRVSIWDAATGKPLHYVSPDFPERSRPLSSLAFSPDGKLLLSGGWEKAVHLWDVEGGRHLQVLDGQGVPDALRALAFSPDGTRLAVEANAVHVLDLTTGRTTRLGQAGAVDSVHFAPDNEHLLVRTSALNAPVRLVDIRSGRVVRGFPPQPIHQEAGAVGSVWCAALSPDGARVLAGADNGTAYLWDAGTGRTLQVFRDDSPAPPPRPERDAVGRRLPPKARPEPPPHRVVAVAFSPDGTRVLTGTTYGSARLWDAATGRQLRQDEPYAASVVAVAFSPDGKQILARSYAGEVRLRDLASGKLVRAWARSEAGFWPTGGRVWSKGADGTVQLWDARTGAELPDRPVPGVPYGAGIVSPDGTRGFTGSLRGMARLWDARNGRELCRVVGSRDGLLVVAPDNHYLAAREALRAVAFRVGGRALPFEQFDLKYNRPDLVLRRIGLAPGGLVDAYHRVYERRLKRLGFTEAMLGDDFQLPEVAILSERPFVTRDRTLRLTVRATDARFRLDRVVVSVNGVPLGGAGGFDLRPRQSGTWEGEVEIELGPGRNAVRVAALNEKGAESLAESFEVRCSAPPTKPNLYAVAVGVSRYKDSRYDLRFAAKDAGDVTAYLESLRPHYGRVEVLRLTNADATREKIQDAREVLKRSKVGDVVVVFVAGHGLLDRGFDYYFGTPDVDFKDPAKRGLPYAQLEGLLDGIPARRKLLLMDTCHAGEVDRDEAPAAPAQLPDGRVTGRGFRGLDLDEGGPRVGTGASLRLQEELFADLRRGSGVVVIAAAGGAEYALEAPRWNNGVFTYALLRGLRDGAADRDKDGRVRVSELRAFVAAEVERLTGGRQRPTMRAENLEATVAGLTEADFALTGD